LKEINGKNKNLKNHIDIHRNFINLIYEFREKVIHQEGLNQSHFCIVPNWNSFIKIDKEIQSYIKDCNDFNSKYKFISIWGVFKQNSELFLVHISFPNKY
jgi:hypothetical protein